MQHHLRVTLIIAENSTRLCGELLHFDIPCYVFHEAICRLGYSARETRSPKHIACDGTAPYTRVCTCGYGINLRFVRIELFIHPPQVTQQLRPNITTIGAENLVLFISVYCATVLGGNLPWICETKQFFRLLTKV